MNIFTQYSNTFLIQIFFATILISTGLSFGQENLESISDLSSFSTRNLLQNQFNDSDPSLWPSEIFTRSQLRSGAILLHIIGLIYMCLCIVFVCNEFFIPSLVVLKEELKLSEYVTGATFMAVGRSFPALLTAVIGVFVDTPHRGSFGGVVGSAVYNFLIIIAACGFFSRFVLELSPWLILKDASYYTVTLIVFVFLAIDSFFYWYEALIMFIAYIIYSASMSFNIEGILKNIFRRNDRVSSDNIQMDLRAERSLNAGENVPTSALNGTETSPLTYQEAPLDIHWPKSLRKQIWYLLTFPIMILLYISLPDSRSQKGRKLYFLTFLGSIFWMFAFMYFVVWFTTTIGETLSVPPEIMGLTFLALVNPDLISTAVCARKGFGRMAVAAAFGTNIFNISASVAIPRFVWSIMEAIKGEESIPIFISNDGAICSAVLLMAILLLEIVGFVCLRWHLKTLFAISLVIIYVAFVIVAVAFEYAYIACPI